MDEDWSYTFGIFICPLGAGLGVVALKGCIDYIESLNAISLKNTSVLKFGSHHKFLAKLWPFFNYCGGELWIHVGRPCACPSVR